MLIAIFPNKEKKESINLAKDISVFLKNKNISVAVDDEYSKTVDIPPISSIDKKNINFLISLGGDGTILNLHHKYLDLNAAIIGINIGQIGFMADIPLSDIYPSLQDILDGNYLIEKRMMIEAIYNSKIFYAANEILLHRSPNHKLIEISLKIDKKYLSTFSADGIIIATPNGSTAYSLSAGGPILTPTLDAFCLNAICPHTISVRPIVISSSHEIEMKYLSDLKHPIKLLADGINGISIKKDDVIKIKKSEKTFNLVKLKRHDYFSTLNSKLKWSGTLV